MGIVYSQNMLNIKFIALNSLVFFITIFFSLIINGVILFTIDSLFSPKKDFKTKFLQTTKILWISHIILLPCALFLLTAELFTTLSLDFIIKSINVTLKFFLPISTLFVYKSITNSNWSQSIKIISIATLTATIISFISHLI